MFQRYIWENGARSYLDFDKIVVGLSLPPLVGVEASEERGRRAAGNLAGSDRILTGSCRTLLLLAGELELWVEMGMLKKKPHQHFGQCFGHDIL